MTGQGKAYSQTSILTSLMDEVKWIVEEHPEVGYRSPTEFVNNAVRNEYARILDRLEQAARIKAMDEHRRDLMRADVADAPLKRRVKGRK